MANAPQNKPGGFGRASRTLSLWVLAFLVPFVLFQMTNGRNEQSPLVDYSDYDRQLTADNVARVTVVGGAKINGEFKTRVLIDGGEVRRFSVLLPVPIRVANDFRSSGDALTLQLAASWLVCKEECIPQEGRFSLKLPARGSVAMLADEFAATRRSIPTEWTGPLQAAVTAEALLLSGTGLPAAWQGGAGFVAMEREDVYRVRRLSRRGRNRAILCAVYRAPCATVAAWLKAAGWWSGRPGRTNE